MYSTPDTILTNERSGDPLSMELLRATKKVRNKETETMDDEDQEMREQEPLKVSFKEMLMGTKDVRLDEDVNLPLNEDEEIPLLQDDVKVSLEGLCPQICFSKEVHSLVDENNRQTVKVRMIGRSISYRVLSNRIETLWGLTSDYKIVDLDNNYFLLKLASQNYYNRVLMGGPWMMYGHYLVVQPWSREFTTKESHPSKIVSWIRLLGLHYRYYTKGLVRALASIIGNVVKVDYNTTDGRRGKFIGVAVVVDMSKS